MHQHPAEAFLDREALEQSLPLGRRDVDVAGHQVGETTRIIHATKHLLDDLFRQAGLLSQLGGTGTGLTMERHECWIIRVERRHLFGSTHDRGEIAILLEVMHRDAAMLTLQEQLHPGEPTLHLADAGDGADSVEDVGIDVLHVFPLRHRKDKLLRCCEGGLDRLEGTGPTGANWRGDTGKQHDLPERKHRKRQALIH